jgi:hypothetical protein
LHCRTVYVACPQAMLQTASLFDPMLGRLHHSLPNPVQRSQTAPVVGCSSLRVSSISRVPVLAIAACAVQLRVILRLWALLHNAAHSMRSLRSTIPQHKSLHWRTVDKGCQYEQCQPSRPCILKPPWLKFKLAPNLFSRTAMHCTEMWC